MVEHDMVELSLCILPFSPNTIEVRTFCIRETSTHTFCVCEEAELQEHEQNKRTCILFM